jgi:hypothetical protein
MTIHNILIIDASGSMGTLASDVRGGHNAYLDKLTATATIADEDIRITLAVFNTAVTIIDNSIHVAKATRLDVGNYFATGMTALLDAVGQTLQAFSVNTTVKPGDKVFVFIQTDGHENSSREYTKAAVAEIIKELEAKGWVFVFSGTGPGDWAGQGQAMGVAGSTSNAATSDGIRRSYKGRSDAVDAYVAADADNRDWFESANVSGLIQAGIDDPNGAANPA